MYDVTLYGGSATQPLSVVEHTYVEGFDKSGIVCVACVPNCLLTHNQDKKTVIQPLLVDV